MSGPAIELQVKASSRQEQTKQRRSTILGNNSTRETETNLPPVVEQTIDNATEGKSRHEILAGCATRDDWTDAGFLSIPKTQAEVRLATASRECLEGVSFFTEIKELLASGEKCSRIA